MAEVKKTITGEGESKGKITTVFTHNTYSDADKDTMNFTSLKNETKSAGEDVVTQFPMPI